MQQAAQLPPAATRLQAALEVLFCLALAGAYLVASWTHVPVRFVIVALAAAILGYAGSVWRRGREGPREFGLRTDNLGPAIREAGIFTAVAAAFFIAYGFLRGTALLRPELLLLLPLYPLYGIGQQLLVQGVFHRRVLALSGSRLVAATATAAAFGLLHAAGDPRLLALTTAGGLGWAILYQRHPNVWVLGVSHGILASLAYPFVLGVDPLTTL